MRKGLIASALVLVILIVFSLSVPVGCANIIPPSGGPRDSTPPVLVNATPHDSALNFKGDRIVLTFDEDLDDPRDIPNNVIYTPSMEVPPTLTTKGRTLTVKFNDTVLQRNTTYVINFGDAIVDNTEGNPVKNFVYTFSTGPYLDSLEISGKLQLAENGQVDTTLNVVLYRDLNDSAILTKGPQYAVRLNRSGEFRFHNLPKDTFAIYAMGGGRRYQRGQLFAFANAPVVAGAGDSLVLYAYREAAAVAPLSLQGGQAKIPAGDRRLRMTPSTTAEQDLLNDYWLSFQVPLKTFDSAKVRLTTDSSFAPASFTATLDSTKKEVRFRTSWKEGTAYHLILDRDFASDTSGRQLLKTDTLSFVTKKKADYGSVLLRFRNIGNLKHPVVEFVLNNEVVRSVPVPSGTYSETLFPPGEYTLRVFDDLNGNGKWDPGRFFGGKRQPEIVHPIQRTFTIKPNWDNEFDVVL